jgi:hypothetical protein
MKRLYQGESVYLYAVKIARPIAPSAATQEITEEFYVSKDIRDVWAAIESELSDEAVEVQSVTRHVPILACLLPDQWGNDVLREGIASAVNALTDSILVSGNDAATNMHFVRKLKSILSP